MFRRFSLQTATVAAGVGASWRRRDSRNDTTQQLGPPRVHRIVITGGPCAGKTTAMSKLSVRLSNMGFAVYVVPELATLTITGGAMPTAYEREQFVGWETAILRAQMNLEDAFEEIALKCTPSKHAVLLCDRGTMDVLAYVGRDTFQEILEENKWTIPQLRDSRYNAVVHLVTAAIGAEDFYTLENNKARMETVAEARDLDGRLSRAWIGHNSLHIIENSSHGFEEKMTLVTRAVCEALGIPAPRATPRWWIVQVDESAFNNSASEDGGFEFAEWQLQHTFLKTADGSESRVTKKSQPQGATTYHLRLQGEMVKNEQSVSERTLSYREYKTLLKEADPARTSIVKNRRAFIWNNEYYMLDTFQSPPAAAGVTTLFIEKPVEAVERELPPFVALVEDVTTKKWFSSFAHDSFRRTMALTNDLAEQQQRTTTNKREEIQRHQ